MYNAMKRLHEATNKMQVFYAYAYNDGPSVGMRAVDTIITDDIAWLIAADAYADGKKLESVSAVNSQNEENLTVEARASAIVHGLYVTVELGKYSVILKENSPKPSTDRGYLWVVRR